MIRFIPFGLVESGAHKGYVLASPLTGAEGSRVRRGDFEEQRRDLVGHLERAGYVRSEAVATAMLTVKREEFVPDEVRRAAYADHPLDIGHGQTISAPHMVAIMVEAMRAKEGHTVLEIGGGSGYHAAVMAQVVGPQGHVYAVERLEPLAERARANLEVAGLADRVTVVVGDGSCGWPELAPFDRISVACAAPDVPEPMLMQLSDGGMLLIPVGGRHVQELTRITRVGTKFRKEGLGGCVFVPLVGKCGY
ncbi:MAG: protein-L-isoaspartate(D-aspartate) O-methyltransferase [Thermoplasmata archaeon]|nr:MAG: protein-L-isoaspartate(D-aspartate) O-methyltransferase [Thermoplasmata archaeon]